MSPPVAIATYYYGFKRKLLIKPKFAIQIRFEIYLWMRIMCEILYLQRYTLFTLVRWICTVFFLMSSCKMEFRIFSSSLSLARSLSVCRAVPNCVCVCLNAVFFIYLSVVCITETSSTNSAYKWMQIVHIHPRWNKILCSTSYIFITQLKCK